MTLPRSRHACLCKSKSGPGCSPRINGHARGGMRRCPLRRLRSTRAHMDDIGNRIPFTVELADLFRIHFERQGDLMLMFSRFGMHRRHIQCRGAKPRSGCASTSPAYCDSESGKPAYACSLLRCVILSAAALQAERRISRGSLRTHDQHLLPWFFFQQHLRKRSSRRDHRINVGLGGAIENQQLRAGRMQKAVDQVAGVG